MEDTSDKRNHEIVKMPQNIDEAHEMLKKVQSLLDNMTISSQYIGGNSKNGFGFKT